MNHFEMNLQNGIIVKENYPIGVYSKHKNTLVIINPSELTLRDKSFKEKEVIDYVLDNGILSRSTKLKVKHAASLNVGYMTNRTWRLKHI
jgi:hypothetical protein